jgi:predicted restriction endonuclease
LVSSHIVRWGDDPESRGRLSNVLCLCRMHDALFEVGYISVADDLRVLKKPGVTSTVVRYLQRTADRVRTARSHYPASVYLRLHRRRTGFEGTE